VLGVIIRWTWKGVILLCPSCGHENREGAKFCGECATALGDTASCTNCGTANPAGQKFCDSCGQSIGPGRAAPAPTLAPAAALPASFAAGRYEVRRFLGEGAKKRVFEAHDTLLDRDVAVSLIRTDGLDTLGRQRVTQEAQALGRLGAHPNIVSVFDLGEHEHQPFIVTELMTGDVAAVLRDYGGPLPLERTLAIAKDVCHGLEFAHGQNVVHRDLKPGNVWLSAEPSAGSGQAPTAKIGDFGLAVSLDRSRLSQQGMIVGTVSYMPPEQALGGEITPRSDLYALGAMLYELVAGRTPFPGEDPTAVISQHINTAPVAPSWYTEHCPPDLEELVLRLLAKDPGQRPASATEVLAALERVDPTQRSASHSESNVLDRLSRGVFVGREAELERLRRAFDEAFAGRGSLVMVVGEPGIGKTRATQELETYGRIRGGQVLWGAAHEAAGAPAYWPWVQVGRAYGSTHDITELAPDMDGKQAVLAGIFPELRAGANYVEPEAIDDPEAAQFRLFDSYVTFVRAMAKRSPLIIALDDLHWADKPTLLLLQHLARELSHMRVLIVCTYRDTDLVRGHPLSEALATLNRGSGFQRVVLRGLSQDEVAGYIRGVANVEPARPVVERIFEETEGNPFFLSEVVNLMAQEGSLTAESVSEIAVPDGVREALGRRLDRISEEANELLQVAAVIGREFTYDTLTLLGERDENELLRLIEEALDARVIEEMEQAGRYRFTHALMQETLLGELSTTRRVRLHGQVGDALERRWGARAEERASRLAPHFVEAAMVTPRHAAQALRYSKLAAQHAEAQFAWAEAAKHYEACLALVAGGDVADSEDEAALLTAAGTCARNDGDFRGAWRALMRAITVFRQRDDAAGMAQATLEALRIDSPPERQVQLARDAVDALRGEEPHLEAQVLALMSGVRFGDEAEQARQRAQELANKHGLTDVAAHVTYGDAQRANTAGDFERAADLYDQAHRQFVEAGQVRDAAYALQYWSFNVLVLGDLTRAQAAVKESLAYARSHHIAFVEMVTSDFLAATLLARCDLEAFDALSEERGANAGYLLDLMRAARAEMTGDLDRAVALLPDPRIAGGYPIYLMQIHAGRARVMYNAGHEERAREEFARMREAISMTPSVTTIDGIPVHGASFGQIDEALTVVADQDYLRAVDKHRALGYFDPTGRSGGRVRAGLKLHLGMVDEAEGLYHEILAWCERERCPIEAGRCEQGLAEVAERRGDTAGAMKLLDAAGERFRAHGATFYLDQVISRKLQLQGVSLTDIKTSIDAVSLAVQRERPDISVHAAPDGTVTLMFSDIEDSTPLNERLGDERYAALLHEYSALVNAQVDHHGGRIVKSIGDGFMVVFPQPRDALQCAVGIQQTVSRARFDAPVQVSIGLHTGEPVREGGDFFGIDVTLASRIGDEAKGGEILVSTRLKELAEGLDGVTFAAGRDVALKGLSGTQAVHEVDWS
jgi:class 3 adenylate cyclase/tetratricopeptide (TPR) repeat protein